MGKELYTGFKVRIPMICSLGMLKMEKNFIAVLDKNYPRQPYRDPNQPTSFYIKKLKEELDELEEAFKQRDITNMKEECADLSNVIDYLFEQLCRLQKYSNDLTLFR